MSKSIASCGKHRLLPVLGVIAMIGVAGCGSSTSPTTGSAAGRLPPIPQLTAGDHQVIAYLERASRVVFNDHKNCFPLRQGTHRVRDDGSPSQAMLSSFAVLKLPTTAAVPTNLAEGGQKVYVNYVRIAQTRFGWPFKIIPLAHFSTESARCFALEASEVHTLVAHAPAKVRAKVDAIEHDLQLDDRYIERHPDGICVSGYHGASLCESFLGAETHGGLSRSGSSDTNPVTFYLVPNGVAHITARYPNQDGAPSRTITVPVINNLAVWRMADEPGDITPTIQWRAASGRIIRTIPNAI